MHQNNFLIQSSSKSDLTTYSGSCLMNISSEIDYCSIAGIYCCSTDLCNCFNNSNKINESKATIALVLVLSMLFSKYVYEWIKRRPLMNTASKINLNVHFLLNTIIILWIWGLIINKIESLI